MEAPVRPYNIGSDLTLAIIDNYTGEPVSLGGRLLSFKAEPRVVYVINHSVRCGQEFKGWDGEIVVERHNDDLDLLAHALEAGDGNRWFSLVITVRSPQGGEPLTFEFGRCFLFVSSEYRESEPVKNTIHFHAPGPRSIH